MDGQGSSVSRVFYNHGQQGGEPGIGFKSTTHATMADFQPQEHVGSPTAPLRRTQQVYGSGSSPQQTSAPSPGQMG